MLVNGAPVGIAKDARHAGGVRRQRPRAPRRAERARRRRRALVGRELRRGSGPVVAGRAVALDPPRLAERARRRGCDADMQRAVHRARRRGRRPTARRGRRASSRRGRSRTERSTVQCAGRGCGRPRSPRSTRSSCRARRRDRLDVGRLPARRDARPQAARQRRAGADRRASTATSTTTRRGRVISRELDGA